MDVFRLIHCVGGPTPRGYLAERRLKVQKSWVRKLVYGLPQFKLPYAQEKEKEGKEETVREILAPPYPCIHTFAPPVFPLCSVTLLL